jgi:hypothetical protein
MRPRKRARRWIGLLVFGALLLGTAPGASADSKVALSADLAGQPIRLADVGKYHCHDLDYPRIHCFRTAEDLAASPPMAAALLSGVTYVTIYDGASFLGSSMNVAQDYDILALIGWNDRVSSFKARNSLSGRFFVDWFGGGSGWSFCCNSTASTLGSFDNTFSSVYQL